MGRHAKGALDVVGALGLVEPDLLGRRLDAFERPVRDHPAARLGDDLGQQCRLVEPTRPLSAPVQRYRNDGVAVSKQSRPARAIQRPMVGARSSRSPYFKAWTS